MEWYSPALHLSTYEQPKPVWLCVPFNQSITYVPSKPSEPVSFSFLGDGEVLAKNSLSFANFISTFIPLKPSIPFVVPSKPSEQAWP